MNSILLKSDEKSTLLKWVFRVLIESVYLLFIGRQAWSVLLLIPLFVATRVKCDFCPNKIWLVSKTMLYFFFFAVTVVYALDLPNGPDTLDVGGEYEFWSREQWWVKMQQYIVPINSERYRTNGTRPSRNIRQNEQLLICDLIDNYDSFIRPSGELDFECFESKQLPFIRQFIVKFFNKPRSC